MPQYFTTFLLLITVVHRRFPVGCSGLLASVFFLQRGFPATHLVDMDSLRARDRARHWRSLMGSNNGVVDFVVQGSSDTNSAGLYFTRVKLGTPPREYNVQIDTGSDIFWVNCNSCSDCPTKSSLGIELNFYDTGASTTSSLVSCTDPMCLTMMQTASSQCVSETYRCGYSLLFGDGSGTTGFYVSDILYFDVLFGNSLVANSSTSIVFGCSTYQTGTLTKSTNAVDGIFGFGQQSFSVVSQLSSRGITPRAFSHCLKGDENGGGILVLGEVLHPNIVYSPIVPSQPHYNLELQSIAIDGQLLPVDPEVFATSNNRGTIIDSGTTLAYLVDEAYDSFVSAVTAAVSQSAKPVIVSGSQCYYVYTSASDTFPSVSLNFAGDASMILGPEEYLLRKGSMDGARVFCIGFQKAQDQVTILGDLVLKDKIVVYDVARQRIGWTNYDCSLPVNVSVAFNKDKFVNAGQLKVSSSSKTFLFGTLMGQFLLLLGFFIL